MKVDLTQQELQALSKGHVSSSSQAKFRSVLEQEERQPGDLVPDFLFGAAVAVFGAVAISAILKLGGLL